MPSSAIAALIIDDVAFPFMEVTDGVALPFMEVSLWNSCLTFSTRAAGVTTSEARDQDIS
jgi:hypothetical protein